MICLSFQVFDPHMIPSTDNDEYGNEFITELAKHYHVDQRLATALQAWHSLLQTQEFKNKQETEILTILCTITTSSI